MDSFIGCEEMLGLVKETDQDEWQQGSVVGVMNLWRTPVVSNHWVRLRSVSSSAYRFPSWGWI